MSFELSPETLIFSLESQIPDLQNEIIDLQNAIQQSQQVLRTPGVTRSIGEKNLQITSLQNRISSINNAIKNLTKEIEVRLIESQDLQEISAQKPNNDLRNALLIGGAILLL